MKQETNKKQWVIKFKDGDDIHHYKKQVLSDYGEIIEPTDDIMTFDTKQKAQKFLDTLDSREYDRWVEEEDITYGNPNNSFIMTYECGSCGKSNNSTDVDDFCKSCEIKIKAKKEQYLNYKKDLDIAEKETDFDIEKIFIKLDINGDISPLEKVEDFWKRKIIEVYDKMSILIIEIGTTKNEVNKK